MFHLQSLATRVHGVGSCGCRPRTSVLPACRGVRPVIRSLTCHRAEHPPFWLFIVPKTPYLWLNSTPNTPSAWYTQDVRDDELRRLLTDNNPWWRAAAAGTDPTAWTQDNRLLRERMAYDLGYRSTVLADLAHRPPDDALVILTGPRRVGKSIAVLELAEHLCSRSDVEPRQVIYLPCDGFAARDLRRALTLGRELTRVVDASASRPRVWLLDEVSSVVGWTTILKAARDGTAFGDDTVVITGSRWRQQEDIEGNLLAGRAGASSQRRVRILLPMTFRSFLEATRPSLVRIEAVHPADLQSSAVAADLEALAFDVDAYDLAWQAYLTCGGFPRAVGEYERNGDVSDAFLRDLLAWLRRDVDPDSAPQSLPLLLEELMRSMTSPLSVRAMAEVQANSRTAMASLLNRLVATYGGLWVPRHDDGGRPVIGAQSKMYLTDPLLASLPSRLRAALQLPEMTSLTEAALGVALATAVEARDEGRWIAGDTIGYIRTDSGNEVDFGPVSLASSAGRRSSVPIEAKWVDSGWRAEAQVMEKKYRSGIMATKSILDLGNPTWAVPAPLVALLLV